MVCKNNKTHQTIGSFFLLINTRSDLLAGIEWLVCISKLKRIFCFAFSWTVSVLCIYHFSVWSNFYFLHSSKRSASPALSYLVFYYFCISLLHSLINRDYLFHLHIFKTCYSVYIVNFSFYIISPYGFIFGCYQKIHFRSLGFSFLAMSQTSRAQTPSFVAWSIRTIVSLPIFVDRLT